MDNNKANSSEREAKNDHPTKAAPSGAAATALPTSPDALLTRFWLDNVEKLYQMCVCHELQNNTETIQWTPEIIVSPNQDFYYHQLIHGSSNTKPGDSNYLYLSNLCFINEDHAWPNLRNAKKKGNDHLDRLLQHSVHVNTDYWQSNAGTLTHVYKMRHRDAVSVARLMPNRPACVCTQSVMHPELLVYMFPSLQSEEYKFIADDKPLLKLHGHTKGGSALEWNFNGYLISAANDRKVCLWDMLATPNNDGITAPVTTFNAHAAPVTDACWHQLNEAIFATSSVDKKVIVWDVRTKTRVNEIFAHEAPVNCLVFNPYSDFLLLSGGAEPQGLIKLWDLRKMSEPMYTFKWHQNEILRLEWDAMSETIFAASSLDKRMSFWDLSRMDAAGMGGNNNNNASSSTAGGRAKKVRGFASKSGSNGINKAGAAAHNTNAGNNNGNNNDAPPKELIFIHGGMFDDPVYDFSFSPHEPWVVAAVGGKQFQCFALPKQAHKIRKQPTSVSQNSSSSDAASGGASSNLNSANDS